MSDLLFDSHSERAKDFFADIAAGIPDEEFYQNHLNQVSRSFAACIAELDGPMRSWVSMTYLLCRWLDTIEDAGWSSVEAQELAFSDFVTYFEEQLAGDPNQQSLISATCTTAVLALSGVTEAERSLIGDASILIAKYSQFPERVREIIACLVIDMASGMSHFSLGEGLAEGVVAGRGDSVSGPEVSVSISQHTEIIIGAQLGVPVSGKRAGSGVSVGSGSAAAKASAKSGVNVAKLNVLNSAAAAKSAMELLDSPVVPVSSAFEIAGSTSRPESVRLNSLRELNQYCFFVAGIVGEALTDLLDEAVPMRSQPGIGGHAFGLFLQKINVLKDQYKDEAEGRYFVANRAEVIESLLVDARLAFEYIMNLPIEQRGYRKFCSWSYFLGLATLPLLMMQTPDQLEPKLERDMVAGLFAMINSKIDNNEQLLRLYFDLTDQIAKFQSLQAAASGVGAAGVAGIPVAGVVGNPVAGVSAAGSNKVASSESAGEKAVGPAADSAIGPQIPAWVLASYGGRLKSEQLLALGL